MWPRSIVPHGVYRHSEQLHMVAMTRRDALFSNQQTLLKDTKRQLVAGAQRVSVFGASFTGLLAENSRHGRQHLCADELKQVALNMAAPGSDTNFKKVYLAVSESVPRPRPAAPV